MSNRYIDGRYAASHPDWHAHDARSKAAGVLAMLDRMAWHPLRVVDVGCGTGDVLREMVLQRPELHGIGYDISDDALQLATPHERVQLHAGPAPSDAAEVCLCLDVVEHVVDDIAFLRTLSSVAPRLILRIPLDLSALDVLRPHRLLAARQELGHLHAYTRTTAVARVEEAGLRVLATRYDRVPPLRDTPRRAWVDRVRTAAQRAAPDLTVDLLGGWSVLIAAMPSDQG